MFPKSYGMAVRDRQMLAAACSRRVVENYPQAITRAAAQG